MNVTVILIAIAVVAAIAIGAFIQETTRHARRGVIVRCPLDGRFAHVRLDPRRAASARFRKKSQSVVACDRWPNKAGCGTPCAKQLSV